MDSADLIAPFRASDAFPARTPSPCGRHGEIADNSRNPRPARHQESSAADRFRIYQRTVPIDDDCESPPWCSPSAAEITGSAAPCLTRPGEKARPATRLRLRRESTVRHVQQPDADLSPARGSLAQNTATRAAEHSSGRRCTGLARHLRQAILQTTPRVAPSSPESACGTRHDRIAGVTTDVQTHQSPLSGSPCAEIRQSTCENRRFAQLTRGPVPGTTRANLRAESHSGGCQADTHPAPWLLGSSQVLHGCGACSRRQGSCTATRGHQVPEANEVADASRQKTITIRDENEKSFRRRSSKFKTEC